jgi:hypothetical protein
MQHFDLGKNFEIETLGCDVVFTEKKENEPAPHYGSVLMVRVPNPNPSPSPSLARQQTAPHYGSVLMVRDCLFSCSHPCLCGCARESVCSLVLENDEMFEVVNGDDDE